MLIFEKSKEGRKLGVSDQEFSQGTNDIPVQFLRQDRNMLVEVSETQVVRHYTRLSQCNFSIDTHFYPLGSCTMKHNPRACNTLASLPGFVNQHPLGPISSNQGTLSCLYELQEMLKDITGMAAVSLAPMAGAQGEFAGVAMIRAYHDTQKDFQRTEIIIPDAAHGTNPASATMCGYKVREIPTKKDGDVDLEMLKTMVGKQTAGIMLTNPSTLGVFEREISQIAKVIHEVGGLLYYDGANLNAILGKVKPGDMGFDVIHVNLHKTFSTPHGGGGPGSGPVGVNNRLKPFLPIPIVDIENDQYRLRTQSDCKQSIGRLSTFLGNTGILLRAYIYMRILGREGMKRVAEFSTLNSNYMMEKLKQNGFQVALPKRRATHEFIITLQKEAKEYGTSAMDVAKRLLDYGYHAPTTYFPLIVPECFLIEPTETEDKDTLDGFIDALCKIKIEAKESAEIVKGAPHTLVVKRLDDVRAARQLDLKYKAQSKVIE